jgi:ribonuclease D
VSEVTPEEKPVVPAAVLQAPIVLVDTRSAFRLALDDLLAQNGPLAVDAERASGFRYSPRAYLVQVHRTGSANYLIDPLGVGDLADITRELVDQEWIVHAAHQDLACLREVGVSPENLFDTELGARLAGLPRVGLQGVVEDVLGLRLAKEHSAADWSTRPLPPSWLTYAALDVELLPRVRDEIHRILGEQNKLDIAAQEFQAALAHPPSPPRREPWRRLSGLHQIRGSRSLAIARELWLARENLASSSDTAPGRLVPDRSLIAAVLADPSTQSDLQKLKTFHGRASRSHLALWWEAIERGRRSEDLPTARVAAEGPPPPRVWGEKNPEAASRLEAARAVMATLSEDQAIPVENLLTPDFLRRLCWEPPLDISLDTVAESLRHLGARFWQIELLAPALSDAFIAVAQPESPGSP